MQRVYDDVGQSFALQQSTHVAFSKLSSDLLKLLLGEETVETVFSEYQTSWKGHGLKCIYYRAAFGKQKGKT